MLNKFSLKETRFKNTPKIDKSPASQQLEMCHNMYCFTNTVYKTTFNHNSQFREL